MARILTSSRAARSYVKMLEAYAEANEAVRGVSRQTPRARQAVRKYFANLNNLKNWMANDPVLSIQAREIEGDLNIQQEISQGKFN
ncbi:MAG: hypothetical protein AAF228_11795 [Pseudomonadota bacterium]